MDVGVGANILPEPEFKEIAQGSVQTCIKERAWRNAEIDQFRAQQKQTALRFEGEFGRAIETFWQVSALYSSSDLKAFFLSVE